MAVKYASNAERDTWRMEIDRNGNEKALETPIEAPKHAEEGLSLTRAWVEKGHCETRVVGQNPYQKC